MSIQITLTSTLQSTHFKTSSSKSHPVRLTFPADSRWTKQSFRDECDINTIMSRYQTSGDMPAINQQAPQYLDATGFDYANAMSFVAGAQTLFQELPSGVRSRFANDPAQFLDFCSRQENRPEMASMGLLIDDLPPAVPYPSTHSLTPPKQPLASSESTPE